MSDDSVVVHEMLTRGPPGIFEMPRDFFRVALERNIRTQVDLHCMEACIRAAPELPRLSRCHVNVFPSTLLAVPANRIIDLFPGSSAGRRFCVEISEQQMIGEPSLLRNQVRALQEAGILVAIDDVGFGHSSLETLILLEPDIAEESP
jgi:EAL domain-containing protein (putative c-di-GMP-specific phosphodiesterase class I)